MRILTPEQAINRLTADKNVARTLYVDRMESRGAKNGANMSLELKAMVAAHVTSGMKRVDVSKLFGIDDKYVNKIARGEKRIGNGGVVPDVELREVLKTVNETVAEKATNLVMAALEQVTEARLNDKGNKLRDVTGAAKDLASIVEKVSPKSEGGNIAAVVLMGTAPFAADRYKVLETSAVVLK